jgi:HK97 family phage portal protein
MADRTGFDMAGPVFDMAVPPEKKASEYLTAYKKWTYAAVSKIAREVSQIELKLYRKIYKGKKLEIEKVDEHEALTTLFYVNDFMTCQQFFELTQIYLDLVGEGPWAILRGTDKKPEQLWPLRPDWVDIKPSKENFISHYVYSPGGGFNKVIIKTEDLVFLKYHNPVTAYRGMGGVRAGSMSIDIDDFSDDWNRTFFYNSALPYIFFTTDKEIGKEQAERLQEMWRSKFQGRQNAHKVAFLGRGLKPEVVGGSVKELDFASSKDRLRDEILAMYHTSKANLGIVEDVNRATQTASDIRYKRDVIRPRMISLVQYINEFYLKNWPDEDLFFDFVDPVPEDAETKTKIYDSGLKGGWLTINEVREEENKPPVEGGDVIYLPFNLQPVGGVKGLVAGLFGKKAEQEGGVLTLKAKTKTHQQRLKDGLTLPIPPRRLAEIRKQKIKEKIKPDLLKLVTSLMQLNENQVKKLKTDKQLNQDFNENGKEVFWKNMVAKTEVQEDAFEITLKALWASQQEEVLKKIEGRKTAKGVKGVVDLLFDLKLQNVLWLKTLSSYLQGVVFDRGREVLVFLGMPGEYDSTTENVVRYLKEEGVKFIPEVNLVTRNALKETLAEGLKKGEGVASLKNRVMDVYKDANNKRAMVISRTEISRATNFATVEAYKQSGIVTAKEWYTALDERVCPWCGDMHGKVVKVDDNYFNKGDVMEVDGQKLNLDYDAVGYPPLHPSCRCTLIPIIKE